MKKYKIDFDFRFDYTEVWCEYNGENRWLLYVEKISKNERRQHLNIGIGFSTFFIGANEIQYIDRVKQTEYLTRVNTRNLARDFNYDVQYISESNNFLIYHVLKLKQKSIIVINNKTKETKLIPIADELMVDFTSISKDGTLLMVVASQQNTILIFDNDI